MRSTAHLNLKWTVADTDVVRDMAKKGQTAYAIALWFSRNRKPMATDEVMRICDDMGVTLRKTGEERA